MIVHPLNTIYYRENSKDTWTGFKQKEWEQKASSSMLTMLDILDQIRNCNDIKSAKLLAANCLIEEITR